MVVRHLIDTKGSYVKTKPIKEVICDDADSEPSLFSSQTVTTASYNNSNKQGKNNNKTATNKALVEKVTYHSCLDDDVTVAASVYDKTAAVEGLLLFGGDV